MQAKYKSPGQPLVTLRVLKDTKEISQYFIQFVGG
jgi:hypothetical protein